MRFRDQFLARYSRESARKLTKEINDASDKKRVQREIDKALSETVAGKHKRRGY